jgi:hypothetical protein
MPGPPCPRGGEPPSTADYGPAACRQWARAAAQEAGNLLPELIAEGLELLAEGCVPEARCGPPAG